MEDEPRECLIQGLFAILGKEGVEELKATLDVQHDLEAVAGLLDFYLRKSGCASADEFIRATEEPPE